MHSLDECKNRIQSLNEGELLHYNRVQFWKADKSIVDYEIKLKRSGSFLGVVSGDLTAQDSQSTLITCKAELGARFKIGIPIYLLLALLVTLSNLSRGEFPFGIFIILWGVLWWFIWTWRCNLFAETLMAKLKQV